MSLYSLTLVDVLEKNVQYQPDRLAVISGERHFTYRELGQRIDRLAAVLAHRGFKKGDRLAVLMENNHAYIEVLFAAAKLGGITVPLNVRLSRDELTYILEDAGCKILVSSGFFAETVHELAESSEIQHVLLVGSGEGGRRGWAQVSRYEEALEAVSASASIGAPVDAEDPAVILYTSGTTGKPKGCMLAHRSWVANNLNMASEFGITRNDIYGAVLPFFHVAGLGTLFTHLHRGGCVVPIPKWSAELMAQEIENRRITTTFLVPPMLQQLITLDQIGWGKPSTLRLVIGGAGFEPPSVVEAVEKKLGAAFYGIYGQTEAGNIVTSASAEEILKQPATYGRELMGFSVRIVDEDDREVPAGEPGELVVRGPSVMIGYWNREEETRETLRNGWLHTGDVFVRHEDGSLEMVDRKKYLIKTGGENVYPAEVEKVLSAHPCIAEVAVVGVPDRDWGESIKAFVVLAKGKQVTREELRDWCYERIARYKAPKYIEFIEEIPRNHSGKPLKNELRNRAITMDQRVR